MVDLFATVYRSSRSGWMRDGGVYHLDLECPQLWRGGSIRRGRLGAMIAAKRRLCAYESKEAKLNG